MGEIKMVRFTRNCLGSFLAFFALVAPTQHANATLYSTTGAGSSTVGGGGSPDYADLASATAAVTSAGSRDATAWTFYIMGDLTESANSEIRCTVTAGGSITFKPGPGVRPTIFFPNTIAANVGASGNILIGAAKANTSTFVQTDNITFDGSNVAGGTTRDMTICNQSGSLEGASGLIRIRGNSNATTIKNCNLYQLSISSNVPCLQFSIDNNSTGDKSPDNWVVDNNLISCQGGGNPGFGILGDVIVATATTGETGWTISNNTILAGLRGMSLAANINGTITGNLIRINETAITSSYGILWSGVNGATLGSATVSNNVIDKHNTACSNNAGGGPRGIALEFSVAITGTNTIDIRNNMVGGYNWTGSVAADHIYRGISVSGVSATTTINIDHNSVNMPVQSLVSGVTNTNSFAIGVVTAVAATFNTRNNLIRYMMANSTLNAIYNGASGTLTSTGNTVVVGSGTNLGRTGGTSYTAFPWGASSTLDTAASGSNAGVDPTTTAGGKWANGTDKQLAELHFIGGAPTLTNHPAAIPSGSSTDMDGDTRAAGTATPGADEPGGTQNTYTCNQTSGTIQFDLATMWTPNRTTRRWDDILQLNNGSTVVLANFRPDSLGGIRVTGNTDATFQGMGGGAAGAAVAGPTQAAKVLDGDNGSTRDLQVGSGSTLRLNGAAGVVFALVGGATGQVDGDVLFKATVASAPHGIYAGTAGCLVYANGATASMIPASTGGGTSVGSAPADSAQGGAIFQSGSTWNQSADKNGNRSVGTGSAPFGGNIATQISTFQSGSNYVNWGTLVDITGRTFANYTWKSNATPGTNDTGANPWTVNGNLTFAATGTVGSTFTWGGTAAGTPFTVGGNLVIESGTGATTFVDSATNGANCNLEIKGNVDIRDATKFTPNASANRVYLMDGTSAQTANWAGKTLTNLTLNNAAGATLWGNVTATNLTATAGTLDTSTNTLTIATSGAIAGGITVSSGGTLNAGTVALSGAGTVNVNSGGTLKTANTGSNAASGTRGTTTMVIDPGATIELNGAAAQTHGGSPVPTSLATLKVNNGSGVTLLANQTLTTLLNLTAGEVNPGVFTLTGPDGASGVVRTSGFVVGPLKRLVNMTTAHGPLLFPVGTTGAYAPFSLTVNTGSASTGAALTVQTATGADPNNHGSAALNRTWTLTPDAQPDGSFDAGVVFGYQDTDVDGSASEANLKVAKDTGGGTFVIYPTTVDTGLNTLTVATGVTGFSTWTAAELTAVPVTLSNLSVE